MMNGNESTSWAEPKKSDSSPRYIRKGKMLGLSCLDIPGLEFDDEGAEHDTPWTTEYNPYYHNQTDSNGFLNQTRNLPTVDPRNMANILFSRQGNISQYHLFPSLVPSNQTLSAIPPSKNLSIPSPSEYPLPTTMPFTLPLNQLNPYTNAFSQDIVDLLTPPENASTQATKVDSNMTEYGLGPIRHSSSNNSCIKPTPYTRPNAGNAKPVEKGTTSKQKLFPSPPAPKDSVTKLSPPHPQPLLQIPSIDTLVSHAEKMTSSLPSSNPQQKSSASSLPPSNPHLQQKSSTSSVASSNPLPQQKSTSSSLASSNPKPQQKSSTSSLPSSNPKPQQKPSNEMATITANNKIQNADYKMADDSCRFQNALFDYLKPKGKTFKKQPTANGSPVDLYALFTAVVKLGGSKKVMKDRLWPNVINQLTKSTGVTFTKASRSVSKIFQKFLREIEEEYAVLGNKLPFQLDLKMMESMPIPAVSRAAEPLELKPNESQINPNGPSQTHDEWDLLSMIQNTQSSIYPTASQGSVATGTSSLVAHVPAKGPHSDSSSKPIKKPKDKKKGICRSSSDLFSDASDPTEEESTSRPFNPFGIAISAKSPPSTFAPPNQQQPPSLPPQVPVNLSHQLELLLQQTAQTPYLHDLDF